MKKKTVILLSILGGILILAGLSYAYFTSGIIGSESTSTVTINSGEIEIVVDGGENITARDIVPSNTPFATKTITLTAKNTTALKAPYSIELVVDNNTFSNGAIKYTLEGISEPVNGEVYNNSTLTDINVTSTIGSGYFTTGKNLIHTYTLKVYFPDTGENQIDDMGKVFNAHIVVNGNKAQYTQNIAYIEDLVDLSNNVNNGNTYDDTLFFLTKNLDFNDDASYKDSTSTTYGDVNGNGTVESIKTELTTSGGFIPIGTSEDISFQGTFEGNNYEIKNLNIDASNRTTTRVGLFGTMKNGEIKNLTVSGNVQDSKGSNMAGILAVAYGNSTITNCHNKANITRVIDNETTGVSGGVVGACGSNGYLFINNSSNKGNITKSNRIGGLIGFNIGELTINNSYNEGDILGGGQFIGGLLAGDKDSNSKTTINSSYNLGSVTNNNVELKGLIIGGLYGVNNGNTIINNSYNSGKVKSLAETGLTVRIGGVIGSSTGERLILNKVYNSGNVSSSYLGSNNRNYCGGIVGNNNSTSIYILNSYNKGNVSGHYTGGLIGVNTSANAVIINNYNLGNITSTNNAISSGIIGYIEGENSIVNINNTYTMGTIIGKSTTSSGIVTFTSSVVTNLSNIDNAYYLNNINKGVYGDDTLNSKTTSMLESEMKSSSFVSTLNNNVASIDLSNYNDPNIANYSLSRWKLGKNAYPVFEWQD